MMLLKDCVIILILTLKSILLCDAEQLQKEDPTVTSIDKSTINSPNQTEHNETNVSTKLTVRWPSTSFDVQTSDGFLLKIFRLSSEFSNADTECCPVLLVHGLYQSSDRFLRRKQEQNLAYKLQHLGYDVWLFNARGNKYSRRHVSLDPEKNPTEFFNYSYEEIGYFDLAATVDFILSTTGFKKMHYISYGMGGTFFLVLNSLLPSYNDKFDRAFLMAPVAYSGRMPNTALQKQLLLHERLYSDLKQAKVYELFPYYNDEDNMEFIPSMCLGSENYKLICDKMQIAKIMELNDTKNSKEATRGGSIKTLIHFAQNVEKKKFLRFDNGDNNNKEVYGRRGNPPEYSLKAITVLTVLIFAPTDEMIDEDDIYELASNMTNVTLRKVERPKFKHDDFIAGQDVMHDVYKSIIEDLSESKKHETPDQKKKTNKSFTWWIGLIILGVGLAIIIFICIKIFGR
ncbi:lipase 3-like [Cydia fagiglandana]|uniref:lipase 3-like n=1 Tax=Cydia fagiglandana TaxID=1458189 RepID=UPI002FEDF0A8